MTLEHEPGVSRRRLLLRLGLAATAAYAAPALTRLSGAQASSISGPSRPSGPSGPSRPAVRRQPRVAPPPPEFLALLPIGTAVAPIEGLGYAVVARRPNGVLDGELLRLRPPPGRSLEAARAEVSALLPVRSFDLNTLYRPNALLCDEDGCAAFEMVDWQPRIGSCGLRPRIGMVDTAVNASQPALQGQRLQVLVLPRPDAGPATALHGTAIATLLIGRSDSRTPGLLPEAELIAANAFFSAGGEDVADAYAIAEAVDLLVMLDVDVINMSFAGPANGVLADLVARAAGAGVALVAAAGNNGPRADPAYPAGYPEVVAVTAVDRRGRIYGEANQGSYIGFAAPGVDLWTAASISGGRLRSGTSYAAPFVTAVLAARRAERPDEPIEASLAVLSDGARDLGPEGPDPIYGQGLIRADFICPN
jgi:hypothetical protein